MCLLRSIKCFDIMEAFLLKKLNSGNILVCDSLGPILCCKTILEFSDFTVTFVRFVIYCHLRVGKQCLHFIFLSSCGIQLKERLV